MRALLAYSFSCAFPASLIYGRVVPPSVRPLGCLPYLASHFVLLCVCLLTPSMSVRVLLLFDRLLGRSSVGGVTRALVCAVEKICLVRHSLLPLPTKASTIAYVVGETYSYSCRIAAAA